MAGVGKNRPNGIGQVRIGISGWRYAGWRGEFYPPKLAQRRELEFASREFSTIEINGTFYSLQRPESFAKWGDETPDDFMFSLKGSRYITHMLKLRNVEKPLANFFAQGLLQLGEKLGPILWQFPPVFKFDRERLESFFMQLPRTTRAAVKLTRKHDKRMDDRSFTRVKQDVPLRHCVEIRHESCAIPEFVNLLREHNVGLVVANTVEWPLLMDLTSDFVCCRLHGSEQLYVSGYEDVALGQRELPHGQPAASLRMVDSRMQSAAFTAIRAMFMSISNNDTKVRAPFDAKKLQELVMGLLKKRKISA